MLDFYYYCGLLDYVASSCLSTTALEGNVQQFGHWVRHYGSFSRSTPINQPRLIPAVRLAVVQPKVALALVPTPHVVEEPTSKDQQILAFKPVPVITEEPEVVEQVVVPDRHVVLALLVSAFSMPPPKCTISLLQRMGLERRCARGG